MPIARMRFPVAAKMALTKAGAKGGKGVNRAILTERRPLPERPIEPWHSAGIPLRRPAAMAGIQRKRLDDFRRLLWTRQPFFIG